MRCYFCPLTITEEQLQCGCLFSGLGEPISPLPTWEVALQWDVLVLQKAKCLLTITKS